MIRMLSKPRPSSSFWISLITAFVAVLAASLLLAWVSTGYRSIQGWGSVFICMILGAGILLAGWLLLKSENPPAWLGALLVGAAVLRLAFGAVWIVALPVWGHGTPAEQAGYVMGDAFARDQAAWKLANSNKPLWDAFQNNRTVDQYGGMLFLSALIYRYLGAGFQQPLLIVIFAAAFSALAVLFTWAFTRRAWGEKIAWLAAWLMAFYPEAILLGSSQMREAFIMTLTIASFYGLLRYQHDRSRAGLAWILAPLLLYLPFSPPFAAFMLATLVLTALLTASPLSKGLSHDRRLWLVLGVLVILVLAGLWLVLKQFTPQGMNNPLVMLSWWLRKSAKLQAYLSQHASGWMQAIFKNTPLWTHLPLLLAYGIVQPFLAAAITVGSHSFIWPFINFFRSIGWTFLLVILIYAPILALRRNNKMGQAISLVVWLSMLVAAFRGGSDLWDNPRYRAAFAGLQVALVAWTLIEQRRSHDHWMRRALFAAVAIVVWFVPWYLQRYYSIGWPITDFFRTLGLGIASAVLLVIWDWARYDHNEKVI